MDDFDAFLAVQNGKLSYYDFCKWMAVQRISVDEDTWNQAYDEGYQSAKEEFYYND